MSLTAPPFIEVPVPSLKKGYICMLGLSTLPLFMTWWLELGTVRKAWYFFFISYFFV
jgi:hypothetical protein